MFLFAVASLARSRRHALVLATYLGFAIADGRRTSIGIQIVSALVFCIGAGGILVRRNPLVILLCLELMLNAGNLALIAFARMHGGEAGQVFALIVMVIAACEVVIGLGIIVAMYRRRLPIDVDEMSELRG